MIDSQIHLQAILVHGGWVEIDTVSDLLSSVTRERLAEVDASV
jgi:hypothetical protein